MIWPLIFSFSTTGRVQKNALAEASAMAKMKDDHFELVINIQKFTPEEVKVYVEGQAVLVTAKKCTSEGFVTDTFENKFNLPEDVDVSRLTSGNIHIVLIPMSQRARKIKKVQAKNLVKSNKSKGFFREIGFQFKN